VNILFNNNMKKMANCCNLYPLGKYSSTQSSVHTGRIDTYVIMQAREFSLLSENHNTKDIKL